MPDANARFACGQCGKSYPWKPEYAGRLVKCKCGFTMKAPATAPGAATVAAPRAAQSVPRAPAAAAPPPSPDALADEFEQAFASGEYDVAPPTPAPPAPAVRPTVTTAASAARSTSTAYAPAAAGVATSPMLGYAGMRRRNVADDEDVIKASRLVDLYVPVALIIAGFAAYYVDAYLCAGIRHVALASAFVFVKALINLVLVFLALMVGVKLIDLGLGPVGPAILKIAAVALLPAAVGDIVGHYTMNLVPWALSVLMYWGLLYYLFEMDFQEMSIVTAIIWVIQTWVSMLLIGLLLTAMGVAAPGGGSGLHGLATRGGASGLASTEDDEGSDSPAAIRTADAEADREIVEGKAVEAREWLKPEHKTHGGFKMSKPVMLEWANKFYAAGAPMVYCAGIDSLNQNQICALLLVEMPRDPDARRAVLKVQDQLDEAEEPTPDKHWKYLHVGLD